MTGILVKRGNLDTDMCTRTASWEDWKHAARSKELVEARREACSRPFPVPSEGALYLDFGLPASRAGDNTSAPQSVVLCLDSLSDIIQCPRVVFSARMGMMWRAAVQDRDQTDIHCGRDCSHRCLPGPVQSLAKGSRKYTLPIFKALICKSITFSHLYRDKKLQNREDKYLSCWKLIGTL